MDGFDPQHPSSRSTPDSTDFEKVEREDVMLEEAVDDDADVAGGRGDFDEGVERPDSSTTNVEEVDEVALRGAGDATPRMKLDSPTTTTASNSEDAASTPGSDAGGVASRDLFGFLDNSLPSWALELLYWRDPKKTGVAFLSCFSLLFLLSMYSAVAVAAYAALSLLTVTFSFVTYRRCLSAIQKGPDVNPFQAYLDQDVVDKINQDCQQCLEKIVIQVASMLSAIRHYFLIVDIFDSLKLTVFLWTLTYVGAWFNLLTLLLLSVVSIFTLPKIYQVHQEQIDGGIGMLTDRLSAQYPVIRGKVVEAFAPLWNRVAPFLPAKTKTQ